MTSRNRQGDSASGLCKGRRRRLVRSVRAARQLPILLLAGLALGTSVAADTPLPSVALDEVTAGSMDISFLLSSELSLRLIRGQSILPDFDAQVAPHLPPTAVNLPTEPKVPPAATAAPAPVSPTTGATGGVSVIASATGTQFSSASSTAYSGPGGSGGSAKAVACCAPGASVATSGAGLPPTVGTPPAILTSPVMTGPDGTLTQTNTIGSGSGLPDWHAGALHEPGGTSLYRSGGTSWSFHLSTGG